MSELRSDSPESNVENTEAQNRAVRETGGESSDKTQKETDAEGSSESFEGADDVNEKPEADAEDDDDEDDDDEGEWGEASDDPTEENEEEPKSDGEDERREKAEEDEKKDASSDDKKEKEKKNVESENADGKDSEKSPEEKKPGEKMTKEQCEALKQRILKDQAERAKLREESKNGENRVRCELSSKMFEKYAAQKGWNEVNPETGKSKAQEIKERAGNQRISVEHGYKGDRYTMISGKEKSSGEYLNEQSARDYTPEERQEKYNLPPENDGKHIRDTQLGKDQFVISFDSEEGKGNSRVFVTDRGYEDGSVKDAYRSVDTVRAEMSEAERNHYDKTDTKRGEVNGREALIRNDIDYDQKDEKGRTNLERMEQGLAPKDSSGKSIELHHMGQKMDGPIAELKREEHRGKGVDTILHDKNVETDINRQDFNKERTEYWKARAEQIKNEREGEK